VAPCIFLCCEFAPAIPASIVTHTETQRQPLAQSRRTRGGIVVTHARLTSNSGMQGTVLKRLRPEDSQRGEGVEQSCRFRSAIKYRYTGLEKSTRRHGRRRSNCQEEVRGRECPVPPRVVVSLAVACWWCRWHRRRRTSSCRSRVLPHVTWQSVGTAVPLCHRAAVAAAACNCVWLLKCCCD
jgi:hypothetical protein